MDIISRGFSGRRSAAAVKLPPGQYLTTDFPVLSAGPTPHVSLERWEFVIDDGTNVLRRWDWKAFRDLPTETFVVDLHCVTRWSKLGTSWEGVSLDTLLKDVKTYLPQVLRAARGAGLAPARAEDVTQATFTTFLERAEEFEGRSHVRTWLFGILYKKIAEARREARRDEQMADIDGVVEQRFNA